MTSEDFYIPVCFTPCADYSRETTIQAVAHVLGELKIPDSFHGQTVLLKPNLISSRGRSLSCTRGEVISAVAVWFIEKGARVKIGDSPAFGSAQSVMSAHGIARHLQQLNVESVNFTSPVSRTLSNGTHVEIAREALECDFLVNLPKLKAHNQMYMTAAVKNYFGTVVGMRKAMLHMLYGSGHSRFSDILLRIPELLPSGLSLIDAVEAMHKEGPMDGERLATGFIGASTNPVALDTALLDLKGLDRERSPLWHAAKELNYPGWNSEDLLFLGVAARDVCSKTFIAPDSLNPIRFNPFRFVVNSLRKALMKR